MPEAESVVEGDLLSCGDIAVCDDPDAAAFPFGAAVRLARVVDEPADVPAPPGVEIVALVQAEDHRADVSPPAHLLEAHRPAPGALGLRNVLAAILDDHVAGRDRDPRMDAVSVDPRPGATDHPRRREQRIGACRLGTGHGWNNGRQAMASGRVSRRLRLGHVRKRLHPPRLIPASRRATRVAGRSGRTLLVARVAARLRYRGIGFFPAALHDPDPTPVPAFGIQLNNTVMAPKKTPKAKKPVKKSAPAAKKKPAAKASKKVAKKPAKKAVKKPAKKPVKKAAKKIVAKKPVAKVAPVVLAPVPAPVPVPAAPVAAPVVVTPQIPTVAV